MEPRKVVLGAHTLQQDEDTQVIKVTQNFSAHEHWDPSTDAFSNDICWVHIKYVSFGMFTF